MGRFNISHTRRNGISSAHENKTCKNTWIVLINPIHCSLTWSTIGAGSLGGSAAGFEFVWSCLGEEVTAAIKQTNKNIYIYTMPYKIQPIRMQESRCIFVSIPPNFPIDHYNSTVSTVRCDSRQFLSTVVWAIWATSEPNFSLGFNFEVKNYYS